jgi:hypothetical protein
MRVVQRPEGLAIARDKADHSIESIIHPIAGLLQGTQTQYPRYVPMATCTQASRQPKSAAPQQAGYRRAGNCR